MTGNVEDSSDYEEDEGEPRYEGSGDEVGHPHGRGSLIFSSGDRFQGRFHHGVKHGKGTFFFNDGSSLSGVYCDDTLEGQGVYTYPDGSRQEGTYMDGELNGPAREYDEDNNLTFSGAYRNNVRDGVCWIYKPDGGILVGKVNKDGLMTGGDIAYVYPDRQTALLGQFEDGQMRSAKLAKMNVMSKNAPEFSVIKDIIYKYDQATSTRISTDPLLPDPYEENLVHVRESTIPGANEGLFASCDIEGDTVVSFYNGIRLTHEEVDARDWYLNSNTISLNDETVIDVPEEYISTSTYRASLGHKANHSFLPNAKYDIFVHPRFGQIKCIRTIQPVKQDEEITVCYGYDHQGYGEAKAPEWYVEEELRVKKRVLESEDLNDKLDRMNTVESKVKKSKKEHFRSKQCREEELFSDINENISISQAT